MATNFIRLMREDLDDITCLRKELQKKVNDLQSVASSMRNILKLTGEAYAKTADGKSLHYSLRFIEQNLDSLQKHCEGLLSNEICIEQIIKKG